MPRCFRLLVLLAALAATASAQTIAPVGTAATFDVATWNLERFGYSGAGPSNDELQRENVQTVVEQSGIDLWALQEINDVTDWNTLLGDLGSEFGGLLGPSVSGSAEFDLRLAYVYDPDVVTVISAGEVTQGMDPDDFVDRLPFQLRATVTLPGGASFELYVLDLHMVSGDEPFDYSRRVNASQQVKAYVDGLLTGGARVIVLGDLNDELIESIYDNRTSPYANFLADDDYLFLTEPFDQPGDASDQNTWCGSSTACLSGSVLDHLILTNTLGGDYVNGSVARYVELLDAFDAHGGEFVNTTSDHLPVYARFDLRSVPNEGDAPTRQFALGAPSPNPFTDAATLTYTLDRSGPVRVELFDALGRRVSMFEDPARPAGTYLVRFNGNVLPPGLYVVRLTAGDRTATRRLVRAR
jgi:endonuclease/exonuclease/phosphatase family metal-dependent hydrolase